jgi:exopolysaccharide biosynthesis polyprenyl glycosylphosphotransferase
MLMIYGREDAITLKLKMDARFDKYHITKLIHESAGVEAISREIADFDAVILTDLTAEIRNDLLKYCYHHEIRTYVAPKLSDIIFDGGRDITLFDTPLRLVKGKGLTPMQRLYKRLMDIVLSLIALVVALPILMIVAIAIKLEDGGPVFYKQKRATIHGKKFNILKFRSMIVDAEKEGKSIPATQGDPRITKVGKIIRATRIDELPQILNILKGDMSIVGPRPERVEHVEEYTRELPEFSYRLKVKGGLTGYAQIYGKYNTSAYDKLRLDLMYIENYTFLLDIKLILMTIRVMFSKDSTEGFDKAEELERMKGEILSDMAQQQTHDLTGVK